MDTGRQWKAAFWEGERTLMHSLCALDLQPDGRFRA